MAPASKSDACKRPASHAIGAHQVAPSRMSAGHFARKRGIDIGGALLLLLLTLPILLLVALAIRLSSHGPILFRQVRVGSRPIRINGAVHWQHRTFRVFKFRTMFADADQSIHQRGIEAYAHGNGMPGADADTPFKMGHDPRITRVGRFLRRTSLDELPQLLNVLRGEMSLVGPRPVPEYEVAHYSAWHRERLDALPGMTGLWQIEGRGRVPFEDAIRLDIAYVRSRSLRLDLTLMLRTIPVVLGMRGAR